MKFCLYTIYFDIKKNIKNLHILIKNIFHILIRSIFCKQNKKQLLVDLEKNTFPRNKIPINWFKSFEKQKKEYELLAKERLKLEKQRNKLVIEIVSFIYIYILFCINF